MLDRSLDSVKSHSTMSFRRKWVSDTNLSKLLHETIEKKHANKQSKLPDFCKDAILGATIKKISSAMVIHREKDIGVVDDSKPAVCEDTLLGKVSWENGSDTAMAQVPDDQEDNAIMICDDVSIETDYKDKASPSFMSRQSPCSSPKRKRQPSFEDTDSVLTFTNLDKVTYRSSPCKKRKEYLSKSQNPSPEIETLDGIYTATTSEWTDDDAAVSNMHFPNSHLKEQRSQSLPHLTTFLSTESMLIASKKNFPPSPVSVVNSISELSIHDCWEPANDGSWRYPKGETAETDPLELNDFFHELKSVSVHPN